MLDSVEAAILALTDGQAQSYTISGRSFTRVNLTELIRWRDRLKLEIADAQGGARNRVAFGRGV